MERRWTYFGNAGTKERPYKIFKALQLSLNDNEAERGFRICIAGLVFYNFDLQAISVASRKIFDREDTPVSALSLIPAPSMPLAMVKFQARSAR